MVRPIDGIHATPLNQSVLRALLELTEPKHALDIAEQTRGADGPVVVFLTQLAGAGWATIQHDDEGSPRFELTGIGRRKATALLADAGGS